MKKCFIAHAYEKEGSTFINKTSYIENCETSAVGRALGFLGIGIDGSVASADEVKTAILNQSDCISDSQLSKIKDIIDNANVNEHKFLEYMSIPALDKMPKSDYNKAMKALEAKVKQ